MKTISEFIIVNVPVNAAYNQWTQFEEFPKFMEGVKEVRQVKNPVLRVLNFHVLDGGSLASGGRADQVMPAKNLVHHNAVEESA